MFVAPIRPDDPETRRAWENYTIHTNGAFYAFFNTTSNVEGRRAYGLDIARSVDGVSWEFVGRDLCPIAGAHAGFGLLHTDGTTYYYPTCSDGSGTVHFKVYASADLLTWEHLGDDFDVRPDPRWYAERWDEICVMRDRYTDADGEWYLGYITAEVRDDVGEPSVAMLRSRDGRRWEVLAPPAVDWGELPSQHMEVTFAEKIDGRYYLCMGGRLYMDSLGYSLYVFVSDSPFGPFRPVRDAFRLCGTSTRDITWLGHTIDAPDGVLLGLWVSARQDLEIPSRGLGIGPLKRLVAENGALRLKYREQNDAAKSTEVPLSGAARWVFPAPNQRTERDRVDPTDDAIEIAAGRDGALVMMDHRFDAVAGFAIEGRLTVTEVRGRIATHQQPSAGGFFFEHASTGGGPAAGAAAGGGYAIVMETLGVTRGGTWRYADRRITDRDVYAVAGNWLVNHRSGALHGLSEFVQDDQVGPFGHASYCGVRHARPHGVRLIVRGIFAELYVDDYYVQTYCIPEEFSGRIGLLCLDGIVRLDGLRAWNVSV
ncbi:MAG: hypothetical protein EA382_17210 [Spirochaetaceae bacterium]|nr:MAG: hypothetical protein EA382_17210 [Spirochaetaceae bacterium]